MISRSCAAMRPAPRLCRMFSEHGAVLAGQLVGGRGRLGLVEGLGLDPEGVAGAGDPGADDGAAVTPDGHGGQAAGEVALLHDLGDHADGGEAALDVGHQQQAAAGGAGGLDRGTGLVGLQGHGEDHPGQHDP